MKVLGIETSCDETDVSIVEDGKKNLINLVASQAEIHQPFLEAFFQKWLHVPISTFSPPNWYSHATLIILDSQVIGASRLKNFIAENPM
ncbi:MAG: hypothetical protein P0S93_04955 [Candidatus Neptunochlamydia sp.]|nr:hypothetical protein [Candidatus Neptunochlamydia sp.]